MKIGIISDTHLTAEDVSKNTGMFQRLERICEIYFKDVNEIIHCGDILNYAVIEYLSSIAPVHFVKGNCDYGADVKDRPKALPLTFQKTKIIVVHERPNLFPFVNDDYSIFLYGHSHIPKIEYIENKNQWWINPGAIKRPAGKFRKPSIAIISLEEDKIIPDLHYLE